MVKGELAGGQVVERGFSSGRTQGRVFMVRGDRE